MTIDNGIRFFKKEGYIDAYTAKEETLRGIYDPMYLVYTMGKLMMLKLRADFLKENPGNHPLKKFHDAYLQAGPIQFQLVRDLLLRHNDKILM